VIGLGCEKSCRIYLHHVMGKGSGLVVRRRSENICSCFSQGGYCLEGGMKKIYFPPISRCFSKTVQGMTIVTIEDECDLSNGAIFIVLKDPEPRFLVHANI